MKKMIYITTLSICCLVSCGPKISPVEYNNVIINEQTKITKMIIQMLNYVPINIEKSEQIRVNLLTQCDSSIQVIKALESYEGNGDFRDAAVALYSFYKDISANEYKEMIQILKKDQDIDLNDLTKLRIMEEDIQVREQSLDNKFKFEQRKFAKEYKITLYENEIQNEVNQLGK